MKPATYQFKSNQLCIHECEGGIGKSVPRDHRDANGDSEGRILISHPHTNNGLFFLLIIHFKKKLPEYPDYAEMHYYYD